MSKVKNKDSAIEVKFRHLLWNKGFYYRKNAINHFGKPDLVLSKYRTVIFIDSCFWHGCQTHCKLPKTRKKFWNDKISKNITRDNKVTKHYRSKDWKIIRVWEHSIATEAKLKKCVYKVSAKIKS